MWENISQKVKDRDYTWLKEGMVNGTLSWCADSSYKRKIAPDVCGVGWVVECSVSGEQLEGCFYEISDNANAYCAEQLGLDAIHHVLLAFLIFHDIDALDAKNRM